MDFQGNLRQELFLGCCLNISAFPAEPAAQPAPRANKIMFFGKFSKMYQWQSSCSECYIEWRWVGGWMCWMKLLFVAYKFYRFSTPSNAAAKYPAALYAKPAWHSLARPAPVLAHVWHFKWKTPSSRGCRQRATASVALSEAPSAMAHLYPLCPSSSIYCESQAAFNNFEWQLFQ